MTCQYADCGELKHVNQRDLAAERLLQLHVRLSDHQRMRAEIEEVLVQSHMLYAEHILPRLGDHSLQFIPRQFDRPSRFLRQRCGVGQCIAVNLAVRGQGKELSGTNRDGTMCSGRTDASAARREAIFSVAPGCETI